MPVERAVYVAGPSAVGKTTILDKIVQFYPKINVSYITYAGLYSVSLDHRHSSDLLLKRDGSYIFEHSIACPVLYDLIHKRYRFFLMDYNKSKIIDNVTDTQYRSISFELLTFYRLCRSTLDETFSTEQTEAAAADDHLAKLKNTVILVDLTRPYYDRYFTRRERDFNGIDPVEDIYLYLQIVAFFALGNFIKDNFADYDKMYVIIDDGFRDDLIFGFGDFGILNNIPQDVNFLRYKFNHISVQHLALKIVNFYLHL